MSTKLPNQNTLSSGFDPAGCCRVNGWTVGTRLEAPDEWNSNKTSQIEITAIGDKMILARYIGQRECAFTLSCRDWREVEKKCSKKPE